MPPAASKYDIVKSYRDLYRSGLHAVQFSSPSRYTLKSHLRLAYRSNDTNSFNPVKVKNTLLFLKHAAEQRGLEHRLLKSLLHVWWWQETTSRQRRDARSLPAGQAETRSQIVESSFSHFTITLKLLNESMDMCLPERELDGDAIEELDHWKQLRFFGEHRRPATQDMQRAEPSEENGT
ncbi:MAG: hypothetical protein Q9210_006916 [Variospora velana]